jgi:hypothetical protein
VFSYQFADTSDESSVIEILRGRKSNFHRQKVLSVIAISVDRKIPTDGQKASESR